VGAEGDGAGEEDAEGEDEDDIVNNEEAALDFFAPETRMPRSDQTRRTLSVGSKLDDTPQVGQSYIRSTNSPILGLMKMVTISERRVEPKTRATCAPFILPIVMLPPPHKSPNLTPGRS